MLKLQVLLTLVIFSLFSSPAISDECKIDGVWQHSGKPAKLFIDLNKGEVSVQNHELNPKAAGLIVLKNLKSNSVNNSWDAKMYSAADGAYVDVKLTAKDCKNLKVSFKGEEVLGLLR